MTMLVLATIAGQATPPPPPFVRDRVKTMTFYYQSPNPALGPTMLKELLRKENLESPWFLGRERVLNMIGSQLGDIAKGHPQIVREYEATFPSAPKLGRTVIIHALMNCGDKETIAKVENWMGDQRFADNKSELELLKKTLSDPNHKGVRDRAAKSPSDLDLLWGNYFITGEYAPIARILDVFDQPDTDESTVMKRVARWSLTSNLQQHKKLAELLKTHAKDRPEASRKVVDQLLRPAP